MHFSELIAEKSTANGGVLKIPHAEFVSLADGWTKRMAGYRYRRETRVEHWQEAIDTVYTAIEKELKTTDPNTIMAHRHWDAMMLAAQTNFPEHIRIYHPTLVEQQRVGKLVKASKLKRTLKDKLELMSILKKDKDLGVKTITDLTVSRLQCEVLAASSQIIFSNYQGSPTKNYTTNVTAETDLSNTTSASHTKSSAEASASYSGSASAGASYDSGTRRLKGGLEHRIKTAVNANAEFKAAASAEAKAKSLMASANAGLSVGTQVSADFDYEISKSCKVKTEYLRRIMGDKFKLIQGHAQGSASAAAHASVAASAQASLPQLSSSHSADDPSANTGKLTSGDFVNASLAGEVEIAVKMSGNAGVTLMQTADIQVSGDLMAGAKANAELKFFINGRGVGMDIGGAALAGFSVGSDQKLTLTHPSRKISIFSLSVREAFNAGAGVEAKVKGRLTTDEICFNTSAGATVGVGASIGFSTVISPRGALLVGYDLIAAPAILGLGELMKRHDPTQSSIHTQRMNTFCDFLNKQASKGEINQVYLDCTTRITSLMASLDNEMDALYDKDREMRTPGFAGYTQTSLTDIQPITSAYFEAGVTKRKQPLQVVFGSEADIGDPTYKLTGVGKGDKGKTIVQENLQTDQENVRTKAVDPAKQNLHTLVAAYEQAKIQGSGERLAFDVIRTDLLNKTIKYV